MWASMLSAIRLPTLQIDERGGVAVAGLGHAGDFAHQFHVAFSASVAGACVFSGQPFNCAVSKFAQDDLVAVTPQTRVPNCQGCPDGKTLPFDHCKTSPHVIDVGSMVDYPRRHCGQNPVTTQQCFDDVAHLNASRTFVFRGTADAAAAPGAAESVIGLLAQMVTDPAASLKLVADLPFPHVLPLPSTPHARSSAPAGYDGPGECLRHVFASPTMKAGQADNASWSAFAQREFAPAGVGFQEQGWVYIPKRCRPAAPTASPASAVPFAAASTAASAARRATGAKRASPRACRLLIRPDACSPADGTRAADVAAFAGYAEANDIVLLHPCVGGAVDAARYPHAPDVAQGKLDVYGQLSADYVQQSAPHMRAIGGMLRRLSCADEPIVLLKGRDEPTAPLTGGGAPSPHLNTGAPASATGATDTAGAARPRTMPRTMPQLVEGDAARRAAPTAPRPSPLSSAAARPSPAASPAASPTATAGRRSPLASAARRRSPSAAGRRSCLFCRPMPTLKINRDTVLTAGLSNTADFAHQIHVAFSSLVSGSCIFSGMPFHCAVTRFPHDYMVPKAPPTAAGIHCPECDANGTLIYDHCKNHPHWVDVAKLGEYAERSAGVDEPHTHLARARVFAFQPTHDRCYQPLATENVVRFHARYAANASQLRLVDDQPFPHTLPINSTPYANNASNATGAGYDGPGECLKHVLGHGNRLYPAPLDHFSPRYWRQIDVSEFVTDGGVGVYRFAWLLVPPPCEQGTCALLILPGTCPIDYGEPLPPVGGSDGVFTRYAAANGIVVLKPCQGAPIDTARFPENHESRRGMVDVYGQLSADYATQRGDQMAPIGRMIKRILGVA